jgi:FkbH-like protein
MKLVDATELINRSTKQGPIKVYPLVCGFTPLHLRTFFQAHLLLRFPNGRAEVPVGLYGDLIGNIERMAQQSIDGAAVVVEWSDLDPRLGIRQLGGWEPALFSDILATAHLSIERLETNLAKLSASHPVALALPTLPIPPIDLPASWQAGTLELGLDQEIGWCASRASRIQGVRVLSSRRLDALSPHAGRLDAKSELLTGFPYRLQHSETVAGLLSSLLFSQSPKKGLITDLDETCWKGILGEVGIEGICWDLSGHGQVHGIYQQFLQALAQRGVLIAAASKNDASLVLQAFQRQDLHLHAGSVFPIEAHWRPKSESVARILEAWNVGADAVVFVDDSPMELAEVQAAHPGIECVLFPGQDPAAVLDLLSRLRDLFGKSFLSEEDRIRSQSIRGSRALKEALLEPSDSYEEVLKSAEAKIHFQLQNSGKDARAFELINKTNQFNLNGKRYDESEWRNFYMQPGSFLLTASYRDKFGPLGEIAVLLGCKLPDGTLRINAWVMSCRAFSRRIEYQCVAYLFQKFGAECIVLDWIQTPRNGPLCVFLASFGALKPQFHLTREQFDASCPSLTHSIEETVGE